MHTVGGAVAVDAGQVHVGPSVGHPEEVLPQAKRGLGKIVVRVLIEAKSVVGMLLLMGTGKASVSDVGSEWSRNGFMPLSVLHG